MSVTYEIKGQKFERACFAHLSYDIKKIEAKKDDTITYYIQSKVTKKIFYKYLLFLRQIPLFKTLLKAPKKIVTENKITLSLSHNALEAFIIFTALRAANEFPKYVKKIASFYPNTTTATNLQILGAFSHSDYGMVNSLHWFCFADPDIKIKEEVLKENNTILHNGIVKQLNKLFNHTTNYSILRANNFIEEHNLNE